MTANAPVARKGRSRSVGNVAREAEVRALEGEGARTAGAARQVVGDARQAQGHRLHPRREAHCGPRRSSAPRAPSSSHY